MVNIDDLVRVGIDQVMTEDLHIACEDDGVDIIVLKQLDFRAFLLGLVFGSNGEVMERDLEAISNGFEDGVIADNQRNINEKFAGFMPREEVIKAMTFL